MNVYQLLKPLSYFRILSLISVFIMSTISGLAAAKSEPHGHYSSAYPPMAGTEYEQSVITIPIYDMARSETSPVEILKLTAFMRLEREKPITNGLGYRQIEFTIADWELYGYSEYLDADVTFTLSELPVQPKSLVIALQEGSDYPSNIIYNAIYDVWIGQKRIVSNKPGVAFTKNVFEIPPRNVSVAFEKPTEIKDSSVLGVNTQAAVGRNAASEIIFRDGTCEDMLQITEEEYMLGKKVAEEVRKGLRSLKDSYYSH
ncbi:hypothetical protein FKG94_00955 [Exilibacterium tricleocarpae]|uniref:Uncharacterized protein n=1 Tax=Exilibacterium tricleocarpae TaxID=2591008 RepID=A0A545U9R3_9GAMM|nr:hypothetical protein [Exilibacterium tricleocarpae]TQV86153.1 hypothetical protein FKG94_00955 [Exilibacterium tricleocarpae]